MSKYPIIIFEGIEASGKTTNFNIAANYLKKRRKSFIKLREPGGSIFSEKIRKLILDKKLNLNNEEKKYTQKIKSISEINILLTNLSKKSLLCETTTRVPL